MKLQEMVNEAFEIAAGNLSYSPDEMGNVPVLTYERPNGAMVSCAFGDFREEHKGAISALMRAALKRDNAVRCVFCLEAWVTRVRTEEEPVRPSDRPDRQEVVMVIAEERSPRSVRVFQAPIIREAGAAPRLGAPEELDTTRSSGRFVGLLGD